MAAALHHLGMIAADAEHDLVTAESLPRQSLTLCQSLGFPRFIAPLQLSLGEVAGDQQDYPRSHRPLTEGLR